MICPNCGKNTSQKERCDHCGMPTEFARRSNPRNRLESSPDPVLAVRKCWGPERVIGWILAITAILTTVGVWMIVFRLSEKQELPVEETEHSVYQTEQTFLEETEASVASTEGTIVAETEYTTTPTDTTSMATSESLPVVRLYWNCPSGENDQDEEMVVAYGDSIPEIPEIEGYLFVGWNTDVSGEGDAFQLGETFDVQLEEELTLYGQWRRIS